MTGWLPRMMWWTRQAEMPILSTREDVNPEAEHALSSHHGQGAKP
jgi:hypothetical protein